VSESKNEKLVSFGIYVKKIRTQKGMTQIEVSSAMNRDQQSLQRVESGRVNPSLLYLVDLAKALNAPLSELMKFVNSD
jgi:transcriptional regulator with XRE-family HTH domain